METLLGNENSVQDKDECKQDSYEQINSISHKRLQQNSCCIHQQRVITFQLCRPLVSRRPKNSRVFGILFERRRTVAGYAITLPRVVIQRYRVCLTRNSGSIVDAGLEDRFTMRPRIPTLHTLLWYQKSGSQRILLAAANPPQWELYLLKSNAQMQFAGKCRNMISLTGRLPREFTALRTVTLILLE